RTQRQESRRQRNARDRLPRSRAIADRARARASRRFRLGTSGGALSRDLGLERPYSHTRPLRAPHRGTSRGEPEPYARDRLLWWLPMEDKPELEAYGGPPALHVLGPLGTQWLRSPDQTRVALILRRVEPDLRAPREPRRVCLPGLDFEGQMAND